MADINLTQAEADALIAMEKQRVDNKQWQFALPGTSLAIPLTSPDKRENFFLDVTRAQLKLTKATIKIGHDRQLFLCAWIWTAHLIATQMIKKFRVRTCTSTEKGSVTSGPYRRPPLNILTQRICSQR
jgi:hypothetical protein